MSIKFEAYGAHPSHDALKAEWIQGKSIKSGGYRIDWGKGYRLEVLSIGRRTIFPQLEEKLSTDCALLGKPVLVIGEEGGGLTSFTVYHKQRLQATLHDFALNRPVSLDEIINVATNSEYQGEIRPTRSKTSILRKPMLFLHLDQLGTGSDFVSQVRSIAEGTAHDQGVLDKGFYFSGRDERVCDSGIYSEFSDVSSVTRLPRLNVNEVHALLVRHLQKPPVDQSYALTLLRWTGGQPLLIQTLLASIPRDLCLRPNQNPDPKLFRRLRDNPPPVVLNWQRRLAQLLEDRKEKPDYTLLRNGLRDLLKDQSYPIDTENSELWAPIALRPLCLAGWLSPGFNADDETRVWRFSELHQFWAQPVLREPKSFLIRSGGR